VQAQKRSAFIYDPLKKKLYTGPKVSSDELTAWIMVESKCHPYAQLWDDAVDAMIKFQIDKTSANKQAATAKLAAARTIPGYTF
jgi:hypothetical protein